MPTCLYCSRQAVGSQVACIANSDGSHCDIPNISAAGLGALGRGASRVRLYVRLGPRLGSAGEGYQISGLATFKLTMDTFLDYCPWR